MSIAEEILALAGPSRVCVHDPAAGLTAPGLEAVAHPLYVRELSALEWNDLQNEQTARAEQGGKDVARVNWYARFVALCLVDAEGQRVFTTTEHAQQLGGKGKRLLGHLYEQAAKLNGLTEDAEKNSGSAPSGASPSGSPAN